MSYKNYIHSEFTHLTLDEILRQRPEVLIGVTGAAQQALTTLKIFTVFDLGMSEIFDNAARIQHGSEEPNSIFRKFGRASRSMVDKSLVTVADFTELPFENIRALIGIGPNNGPQLEKYLSVSTVRDLSMWPPYLAAKSMVVDAYNPDVELKRDPDAPAELIPKSGEYGTERYLYSSLVMFPGGEPLKPVLLNNRLFDITATPETGFDRVRFGALLTYSQTWFPSRVAKGQLLHSLPLAPGESTRVAVIDWSNKSSASTSEALSETEKLSNTSNRARTISEVADTVANEFQSGSSQMVSESTTASVGGAGLTPFLAGVGTAGASIADTSAATHTVSSGSRDISTHLSQNIQDTTQQTATAVRGQHASVISEVSQSQSERLSTRTVTNYNHMHAMTVQYYEVVQIYETQVRLEDFERCIFIPLELVDFLDERNILKYLPILKSAALDNKTREMLETVEDTGMTNMLRFHDMFERVPEIEPPTGIAGLTQWDDYLRDRAEAMKIRIKLMNMYNQLDHRGFIEFKGGFDSFGLNFELQLNNIRWVPPNTGLIHRAEIEMEDGQRIVVNQPAGNSTSADQINTAFDNGKSLSFGRIHGIRVFTHPAFGGTGASLSDRKGRFELAVKLNGESRWLDCSFYITGQGAAYNGKLVFEVETPSGLLELGQRLMDNQLYYSQQIWARQNPQTLIMQLAPFTFQMGPESINLVDYITPVPLKIVGNYAVYKFTYDKDNQWEKWVADNIDKSRVVADQVAIPTGGVFAEAVLGRFNSAEKIDATRFFNWQDSPPDEPPGIAPLRAGQRTELAQPAEATGFDTPVVKYQIPQALPDPTGLSSALTAIVTADVFRNMSGAAATGAAGEAAAAAASETSINALATAGSAFAKTLATLSKAFSVLGSSDGLNSLSSLGALFNEKKKSGTTSTGEQGSGTGTGPSSAADNIVDDAIGGTYIEDIIEGTTDGTAEDGQDTPDITDGDDFPPIPQLFGNRPAELDHPPLGLLTIYLSQYEGDRRIPPAADELYRWNIVQGIGQQLRHHHLSHYRETSQPVTSDWLYEKAQTLTGDDPFLSLLLCHNHTRSLGLRENNLTYDQMALPWEKLSGDDESVKYKFGVYNDDSRKTMKEYAIEMFRNGLPLNEYEITVRQNKRLVKVPSGFYLLHDPAELGPDAPNDWYHYFLNQMVTAGFSSGRIDAAVGLGLFDLTSLASAVLSSDDRVAALKERLEPVFWTFALYAFINWLVHLLRKANPGAAPDNNHYEGWLWMNSMSFMEGLFYEEAKNQEDSTRESRLHRKGALAGILRIVAMNQIADDGSRPTWRWYVPKAMALREKVEPIIIRLKQHLLNMELQDALSELASLDDELGTLVETVGPYIHEILDIEGNVIQSGQLDQGNLSVTAMARAILESNAIVLADDHSSSNDDNATARQNILDTADGNPAARSNYDNAPGGTVMLDASLLDGILRISEEYTIHISELAGGSHSANSRHYAGVAVDINYVDGNKVSTLAAGVVSDFKQLAANLGATEVLGPGDAGHSTHFHLAWPRP